MAQATTRPAARVEVTRARVGGSALRNWSERLTCFTSSGMRLYKKRASSLHETRSAAGSAAAARTCLYAIDERKTHRLFAARCPRRCKEYGQLLGGIPPSCGRWKRRVM